MPTVHLKCAVKLNYDTIKRLYNKNDTYTMRDIDVIYNSKSKQPFRRLIAIWAQKMTEDGNTFRFDIFNDPLDIMRNILEEAVGDYIEEYGKPIDYDKCFYCDSKGYDDCKCESEPE